jgi:hypothetical protein
MASRLFGQSWVSANVHGTGYEYKRNSEKEMIFGSWASGKSIIEKVGSM